jgi:ribonuclease HI
MELYFDGACEPVNPGGTAAYGWVIYKDRKIFKEGSGIVGSGEGMTNNIAEYTGLLEGVKAFKALGEKAKLTIRGDSNLVVSMVAKRWGWNKKKTRWVPHDDTPHLKDLLDQALDLLADMPYTIEWVPREKNREADRLSKKPLVAQGVVSSEPDTRPCPVCGNLLVRRKGKFGEFYGCKNYPKCTYSEQA